MPRRGHQKACASGIKSKMLKRCEKCGLTAIDRLVHHATILEMNVESYRRRAALDRKRASGRSPTQATSSDNQNRHRRKKACEAPPSA
jgi:hypothetical protein